MTHLRELLLHQDNLLYPFDYKVAPWVIAALFELCQLFIRFIFQNTLFAAKHDWNTSNLNAIFGDELALPCVTHIYVNRG